MNKHIHDGNFPIKHNFIATTSPTSSDNYEQGYRVGSMWIKRDGGVSTPFLCVYAPEVGNAEWVDLTAGGGGAGAVYDFPQFSMPHRTTGGSAWLYYSRGKGDNNYGTNYQNTSGNANGLLYENQPQPYLVPFSGKIKKAVISAKGLAYTAGKTDNTDFTFRLNLRTLKGMGSAPWEATESIHTILDTVNSGQSPYPTLGWWTNAANAYQPYTKVHTGLNIPVSENDLIGLVFPAEGDGQGNYGGQPGDISAVKHLYIKFWIEKD